MSLAVRLFRRLSNKALVKTQWFKLSDTRLPFFSVHWSQGKRLVLQYAAVTYLATDPKGRFLILGPGIKVEGHVGGVRKRARRELEMAAEALISGMSSPASEATSGVEKPSTTPIQPSSEEDQPYSVERFATAFQSATLEGVYHLPDDHVRLQVFQRVKGGWEEFLF